MGLNPLNLQLSVPRSPELSSLQQQAITRPVIEQTMLESSIAKETEEKRTQTSQVDEIEKGVIRDQEKEQGTSEQEQHNGKHQRKKPDKQGNAENHHPYKGHKLDIRL